MPDYNSTRARAETGAALLDEAFPGWHRIVILRELSCEDEKHGILGQLASRDVRVRRRLLEMMHPRLAENSLDSCHGAAVALFGDLPTPEQLRRHGFSGSVWVPVKGGMVDLLEAGWREQVARRKTSSGG